MQTTEGKRAVRAANRVRKQRLRMLVYNKDRLGQATGSEPAAATAGRAKRQRLKMLKDITDQQVQRFSTDTDLHPKRTNQSEKWKHKGEPIILKGEPIIRKNSECDKQSLQPRRTNQSEKCKHRGEPIILKGEPIIGKNCETDNQNQKEQQLILGKHITIIRSELNTQKNIQIRTIHNTEHTNTKQVANMSIIINKSHKRIMSNKGGSNFTIRAILLVSMLAIWPESIQRATNGQLPWIKGQEPKIQGYDCEKTTDNRNIEYHREKACVKQDELYVRQRNISAMVIQDTTHVDIPAVRCRLKKASYYAHCGMFSHVTPINYMNSALMDTQISNDDCRRAHSTGFLRLSNGEDYGVKKTGISTLHVETRGGTWLTSGAGNCLGEEFTAKGSV